MKQLLKVASGEWRFWLRSQLVISGVAIFAILVITTIFLTAERIKAEQLVRVNQQAESEETFLAQPDRHPHRMVHYGHYVFRSPAPMAIFDPGIDSLTGQSIFLEGHRQNSAMFAESSASADLGGLAWLTPALVYQLFAPLLLVLLGHSAVVREREAGVLTPILAAGLGTRTLLLGKLLALVSFAALLLVPMLLSNVFALASGEAGAAVISLLTAYFVYLCIWSMLTLLISSLLKQRAGVLATLSALWIAVSLVIPSIAVDLAARKTPLPGKIETDLTMLNDLRKLGDGHNANDPAFAKFRADLLEQYGVERIEDLPINFRGLVAAESERKLTDVMNEYASRRMQGEIEQEQHLITQSWLTPTLAIAIASRAISGTDLTHYHRFLNEAETLRYEFVQGLNNAHIEELSYQDDINRNKDEASWQRARIDSKNWAVLDEFVFTPAKAPTRIANASQPLLILGAWFAALLAGLFWAARRLKP